MRIANLVVSAIFVALIAAPFGSAMVAAVSSAAPVTDGGEQKPISVTSLLTEENYRDGVIRDVVLGSPVGTEGVKAKAWLDYRVIGYADRPQVISGIDGWLFYKSDFDGGRCRPKSEIEKAFDTADVAWELAAAISVDFRISVAPDKSVVYPEKLGARATALAGCKLQNAAVWRAEAVKRGSPWLIDHLSGLRRVSEQTYYATDTHWNDFGFAIAFAQLIKAYSGISLPLPTPSEGTTEKKGTDLLRLIGLNGVEPTLSFAEFFAVEWPRLLDAPPPGNTVVIYDSFFNGRQKEVRRYFQNADMYHVSRNTAAITPAVAMRPRRILMETVERHFFPRVDLIVGWRGSMGEGLHQALTDAASDCQFEEVALTDIRLKGIEVSGPDLQLLVRDPQAEITLPSGSGSVCVRATYGGATGQKAEIFLPDPRRGNPRYRQGRSVPYTIAGNEAVVSLVLPEIFRGMRIRLDPASGARRLTNFKIEVGDFNRTAAL